ncbi:hypothetical protein A3726_14655 [Erythrobacter sp. HI0037]|nr:hypothetical protein A3719_02160 [Erythrobacter sp. HI0020]KZY12550.1 hypothetical protein A3726_14655 [Erythrobacter sp. HI0037]KZY17704.1 hypothetical protein A3727_05170 [Erythrobacter sp. HI0038]KZY20786.1 hypothetical protein A3727_24250 [Erythrobacter sp. HI0038]
MIDQSRDNSPDQFLPRHETVLFNRRLILGSRVVTIRPRCRSVCVTEIDRSTISDKSTVHDLPSRVFFPCPAEAVFHPSEALVAALDVVFW